VDRGDEDDENAEGPPDEREIIQKRNAPSPSTLLTSFRAGGQDCGLSCTLQPHAVLGRVLAQAAEVELALDEWQPDEHDNRRASQ